MEEYFLRKEPSLQSSCSSVDSRADIILTKNESSILIDVTSTEATVMASTPTGYSHAGCAAKAARDRKLSSYSKLWDLESSRSARLVIIPFEVNVVLDKQTWLTVSDLLIPKSIEARELQKKYLRQHLSIALHALRADSIEAARSLAFENIPNAFLSLSSLTASASGPLSLMS